MTFIRGGETIKIKRRSATATDDYGNNTYSTTIITVRDALIGIGGSSEPADATRDAVDATVTAFLPNGTKVEQGDVFIIRGSEWVKDGSPHEWVSPFSNFETGVVVPLRKRRG